MRFLELALRAFGPFRNVVLDVSRGSLGLHMIHGPNEAGKSSALRAVAEMLFGIHGQSRDDFRVSYKEMAIGATVADEAGTRYQIVRRKGNKQTLRGSNNEPIDESWLKALLGGVDREQFALRFGLDQERLRSGGGDLAGGSCRPGEALFGAGTDLRRLRRLLVRLEGEAGELFKGGNATTPRINRDIKALEAAEDARVAVSLNAEHWSATQRELEEAQRAADEVRANLALRHAEVQRLDRFDAAGLDLARRAELEAERQNDADLPRVRPDFCQEVERAVSEARELRIALQALREQSSEAIRRREEVAVDPVWTAESAAIELLAEQWSESRRDVLSTEVLRLAATDQARGVEAARRACGLDEGGEPPRPTKAVRRRIEALSRRHAAIATMLQKATADHDEAIVAVRLAESDLANCPPVADSGPLSAALAAAEPRLIDETRAAELNAEIQAARDRLASTLHALMPWQGPAEMLSRLATPTSESLAAQQSVLDSLAASAQAEKGERKRIARETQACQRALAELALSGEVPSAADLLQARSRRDAAWAELRHSGLDPLDRGAADRALPYEALIRAADELADRQIRAADTVARRTQLELQLDALEQARAEQERDSAAHARERANANAVWAALWEPLGFLPPSPAEARGWLARLQEARREQELADFMAVQRASCQARLEGPRAALTTTLAMRIRDQTPAAAVVPLSVLVERARGVVTDDRASLTQRESLAVAAENACRLRDATAQARDSARKDEAEWRLLWEEAVGPLGLSPLSQPDDVAAALEEHLAFHEARDRAESARARLSAAESARERLQALAAAIVARLGLEENEPRLETLVPALTAQLLAHRQARARRSSFEEQVNSIATQLEACEGKRATSEARLAALAAEAGVATQDLSPLAGRLRERDARESEWDAIEDRLRAQAAGRPVADLVAEARADDPDSRSERRRLLTEQTDELRGRGESLNQRIGQARNEIERMRLDASRALGTEKSADIQDLLARLGNAAERYAELRVASALLRRAIELYRNENQGTVLDRAGSLFRRLTLGAFTGIEVLDDEKGEARLAGLRTAPTEAIDLADLSEGTRDQLYLALRLASLEESLRSGPRLPLLLDDILVSFDDDRAAAALEVLAELSQRTQILFFTHHERLVELAESRIPADVLFVNRLPRA